MHKYLKCDIKSNSELSKRFLLKITKSEAPQAKAKSPQQQDPSYRKAKREGRVGVGVGS